MIAINGRFVARRMTGQERFATEVVRELDKICDKNDFVLVIPNYVDFNVNLRNIKIEKYGNQKSHFWEQVDFTKYLMSKKIESLNLCTIQSLVKPGVVCIHDISYKINPQYFTTRYGKMSALWHRVGYYVAAKKSDVIFTVTECSKNEISKVYKVNPDRITVVPNGWEHIKKGQSDLEIFNKLPQIRKNEYFISIGSLAPNKNLKWVFEAAKVNPNKQFVIVGRASLEEYGVNIDEFSAENVILTGYVSDEELKALLNNCRALIFPSTYEGFGIPPLEALALGKEAIVAKTSCMPEIFDGYVHYLDPLNADVDIDSLMNTKVKSPENLLEKYSYKNAAKIIYNTLKIRGKL